MKWIPVVVVVASALGAARDCSASSVVVPGNYATIQEAIDSPADTVYVSDGVYEERIRIDDDTVLLPRVSGSSPFVFEASPVVRGMMIHGASTSGPDIIVRGIRFLGAVAIDFHGDYTDLTFEQCRFDSAFTGPSNYYSPSKLVVRGCLIFGRLDVRTGLLYFIGNSMVGGGLSMVIDGTATIRHNDVVGSADYGFRVWRGQGSSPQIEWNTIRNCLDGIVVNYPGARIKFNRITDSGRDAISLTGPVGLAVIWDNIIENTGRHGVYRAAYKEFGPTINLHMAHNTINDAGGSGLFAEGKGGFWLESNLISRSGSHAVTIGDEGVAELRSNRIIDAGGDGLRVSSLYRASGNVVGRSAGAGISAERLSWMITNNTLYSNGGPGVLVEAVEALGDPTVVRGNISAFNTGAGLQWLPPSPPDTSGCNDWFGNVGGATLGIAPSPADFDVNPLFCNVALDDVHLSKASPLANAAECGPIGALGTGCGATAAVESMPASNVLGLRVGPTPASGAVQFALNMLDEPATLEVFDITGARRWDTQVPASRSTVEWQGTSSDGHPLPAGVYFARLTTRGGQSATARVLLAR